jgi:exopolysaccharide production protein ExoZ
VYKTLQASRAIAAILVVLFHLGANLAKESYFDIARLSVPFSFGSSGVEFFFVLSGFIIFAAHRGDIGQPDRFSGYMRKRLLRIFPTYWLVFLPVFFIALLTPSLRNGVPHDLSILLQSLLLVPLDKAVVGGTGAPVLVVAWTLQYEMLFYLFFGLLILSRSIAVLTGLAVVGVYVARVALGADQLPFPASFIAQDFTLLFGMGMFVSWLVQARKAAAHQKPGQFIALGLVVFLLAAMDVVFKTQVFEAVRTLVFGVAASLVIFGLVVAEDGGKTYLGHKWLQLLGDSSYALYLIHFPLISVLCKVAIALHLQRLGLVGAIASFVVIFVACLVTSVLFHLWVERPIAAFFKRPKAL